MDYFKKSHIIHLLIALIILGCSSNDDKDNANDLPLEIMVTNFETSYSKVKIEWKLTRPSGVIIEDLQIYRIDKNQESAFYQEKLIANLPSNETSYVDNDVPYKIEVSYKIKIRYKNERVFPTKFADLESEQKTFKRQIVIFNRAPFQVQRDPLQPNIFHILDKDGNGYLKKYNSMQNNLEQTKTFTNGSLLNNKFHIVNNNEIYLADTKGKIFQINANNYQTIANYSVTISDNLNAFAISGNRIYFQDEEIWGFYTILTGISKRTGIVTSTDYIEYLGNDTFLFLFAQNGYGLRLYGFSTDNCNSLDCTPTYYNFPPNVIKTNTIDPNILSWNSSKTKFITSINGCVFNITNLKPERTLNDITGKHYFQYAFDSDNNVYATVQGEKKIHKFNSNYELIEVIDTKLYPLFPLITNDGLKIIGCYEPISYWSFEYGYSFNFNGQCAIEILN
jgi:hypothetical protein